MQLAYMRVSQNHKFQAEFTSLFPNWVIWGGLVSQSPLHGQVRSVGESYLKHDSVYKCTLICFKSSLLPKSSFKMTGTSVLVLGGTGPAGICLVRELLHRKIQITVFARNPSKLPEDVASSAIIEVCLPLTFQGKLKGNTLTDCR